MVLMDKNLRIFLDRYLCPRCNGVCADRDLEMPKIDFDYLKIESSQIRGKVGDQEGNCFSGVIVKEPEKAHRFWRGFQVGLRRQ